MKYRLITGLFGLALLAGVEASDLQVSLDDIVLLNQRGLSDQTILLFLEGRELGFDPDVEAIDSLLSSNVSEEIISYLLSQAATTKTVADASPSTNTVVVAVSPLMAYPGYYYAPYYYGPSFSFGFANYPHAWFGHYSGARHFEGSIRHGVQLSHSSGGHFNQHNGHATTHPVQHGVPHAGGAVHSVVDDLQGAAHSSNNSSGRIRQHTGMVGGRHSASRGEQTVNHRQDRVGHVGMRAEQMSRPHAANRGGRLHSGDSGSNGHKGGRKHGGGSNSGGRHGGGGH